MQGAPADSIWTEELRARLRAAWFTDKSTAQIGLELDCSKNAVISRARREGLPQRSPAVSRTTSEAGKARYEHAKRLLLEGMSVKKAAATAGVNRARVASLRDELRLPVIKGTPVQKSPKSRRKPFKPPKPPVQAEPIAKPAAENVLPFLPRPKVQPVIFRREFQCQWLEGAEKPWEPCCEPSVTGYSYCAEHCRKAYVEWTGVRSGWRQVG